MTIPALADIVFPIPLSIPYFDYDDIIQEVVLRY
ncbi:hypothetical protein SAMN05421784_101103 [Xenorhabdus koppenhoeferi]|uniref:Uncharacterized protein n=1 Tax=Xenorhabdus koppenhoeferi TaxID=351659 RepID=A0A1I7ET05_9GAMM|nr:hypothetical protein SAMN05421784_101103 [Xenorhabdus koppenhoeferi]